MGVDTKMFVTVGEDKFYDVLKITVDTLNRWQRDLLDQAVEESNYEGRLQFLFGDKENSKAWSNGVSLDGGYVDCLRVLFRVGGENRQLSIISGCHNDNKEVYEGEKTHFSLGCWGRSEEIMKVLAEPLKELGDVYYVYNDCQDEFIKL